MNFVGPKKLYLNPRRALAERIEKLHSEHGQELAVREWLAEALCNAAAVEPDPTQHSKIVKKLTHLAAEYPGEPVIKEALARLKEGQHREASCAPCSAGFGQCGLNQGSSIN